MRLKVLHISPEHLTGTLSAFKKGHTEMGTYCRFCTLFKSKSRYDEDVSLNLSFIPKSKWLIKARDFIYKTKNTDRELPGYPPLWRPSTPIENLFFKLRDEVWSAKIETAIEKYDLLNFDIYHLESGLGFYRDGRVIRKLKSLGKKIVCFYHGQDLRIRGVIPQIDELNDVNLTSELDLLRKHPKIEYLFLPFDTSKFKPKAYLNKKLKICHATTNRYFKGSDRIIQVCEELEREHNIEFVLIENRPHSESLQMKSRCDVYIDQISNTGGWGYGMNSVEALSMGLACLTNLVPTYEKFIPDHPFINITPSNMKEKLAELIHNKEIILKKGLEGRRWVEHHHEVKVVLKKLYQIYRREGWI